MTSQPLLILGASTRAAAWSALRAGFAPICADLFLDTDLQAVARVLPVTTYPQGFWPAVEALPSMPWIYTGGLENSPELVERISSRHPLLGAGGELLARVRDPWRLQKLFAGSAVEMPRMRPSDNPPKQGSWLVKPLTSSGGRGVTRWTDSAKKENSEEPLEPFYFQEFLAGRSLSALCLGTEFGSLLLGTAEQLPPPPGAPQPFAYFGSSVPASLSEEPREQMRESGEILFREVPLRGLFGCDFLLSRERLFLLEVNPRYTASVELHEQALQVPLLAWHYAACTGNLTRSQFAEWGRTLASRRHLGQLFTKQILYADRDGTFPCLPELFPSASSLWDLPRFADIPAPGARLNPGDPVCSVFAQGRDWDEMRRRLQESQSLLGLN